MQSAMDERKERLHKTFGIERNGGSIHVRDDSTLMLINYNLVHVQRIDAVKAQYPNVEIYFENYSHSSSGYVVFFLFKPPRAVLTSSDFFQFLCLAALAICFYGLVLHSAPFGAT